MGNSAPIEIRDRRQQDWVWTSKALLFDERIDASAYKVYGGLASYANNQTQEAFPSIDTLAKRLHLGRNTVMRALGKLEEHGAIGVERTEGMNNVYSLLDFVPIGGKQPKKKPATENPDAPPADWVKKTLEWAERRRGSKFVVYGKQIGALGLMAKSGYTPREVCECYILMEQSDFWRKRGFDFTNIANEIPKKITSIRKQHGAAIFDHVVAR